MDNRTKIIIVVLIIVLIVIGFFMISSNNKAIKAPTTKSDTEITDFGDNQPDVAESAPSDNDEIAQPYSEKIKNNPWLDFLPHFADNYSLYFVDLNSLRLEIPSQYFKQQDSIKVDAKNWLQKINAPVESISFEVVEK